MLQHSNQLEKLIKLPSHIDECSTNPREWSHAIDMIDYITDLNRRYSIQVPIINYIYKQCMIKRDRLLEILCDRMEHIDNTVEKETIKAIVCNLSRLGNYTDRELRLKYLNARDIWFNAECEKSSSSFDEVVSVHCTGLPSIFEEYKTFFGDSDLILAREATGMVRPNRNDDDGAIINSWLLLKSSIFIASLDAYLNTIHASGTQTPTMMGDTIEKCCELTSWLASIGFDFSAQLRPLLSVAIINELRSSVDRTTVKFEANFSAIAAKSVESLLLPCDDEILRIGGERSLTEPLPASLNHYPVFKIYCLHLLDSFRWLKAARDLVSPISLCTEVYATTNASLTRVTQALALIANMDNNMNHPILSKIAMSLIKEVVPFLSRHCERIFPERLILNAIGLSTNLDFRSILMSQPDQLKNFRLDARQIVDPLKHTMPAIAQLVY